MNTESRLLTEFDLKYISDTIGRIPNEMELTFIEDVLHYKLKNREYLEILARLNNGVGREENSKITLNDEQTIKFLNGVKVYEDIKLKFDRDNLKSEIITNGLEPIIGSYSIVGNKGDITQINKKIGNNKHPKSILNIPSNNELNEIQFSTAICLDNSEDTVLIDNINDFQILKINFGKNTIKNQLKYKSLIDISEKNDWNAIFKVTKNYNVNCVLVDMLNYINNGVIIPNNLWQNNGKTKNTKMTLFVVLNKNFTANLKYFCKKSDIDVEEYGKLIYEKSIQVIEKDQNITNLPLPVFDLRYDINTKHYEEPKENISISKDIIKGVDKTSLNNQLLKLFEIICKTNNMWHSEKRSLTNEYSRYGIRSNTKKLKDQIFTVQADNNNLLNISPRMSGKMSVANASRRMSCMGIKPMYVAIHNIFPKPNLESNWIVSELLQGQEEAIREIDLEIGNREIDTFDDNWYQNILTVGYVKNKSSKTDISFKNNGDFISLLGSHRGELGGSEYEKYISDNTSKSFPSVDLNMERRLQDVVQQGINTNLIKSATNVGMGGISIAIAKSLFASDAGIGARIHLSRKLTDQELLFGETQGLVVVTLSEEDIMEFERICMTVGVPSTTIGRVTDNNLYTFNESISVKVDKLRKVIN